MPEPFLAILSQIPSEDACCSSRKTSHAPREANGKIGKSGLAVMASSFRDRCFRARKRRKVSSERPILLRDHPPNRRAERALALAASFSRSLGGALVSSEVSNRSEIIAMSSIAELKAASLAFDGLLKPVTFLTY